jgi:hypothetical protein
MTTERRAAAARLAEEHAAAHRRNIEAVRAALAAAEQHLHLLPRGHRATPPRARVGGEPSLPRDGFPPSVRCRRWAILFQFYLLYLLFKNHLYFNKIYIVCQILPSFKSAILKRSQNRLRRSPFREGLVEMLLPLPAWSTVSMLALWPHSLSIFRRRCENKRQ